MRRKVRLIASNTYHLYNRGVNHQNIFFIRENWPFFLRRLRHYCPPENGDILAYCLMPNHYHLLVTLKIDDFSLEVMQPFMVSYTKAINKQHGRVGPLFQGPFQARHVATDSYLLHLTRYIHLNPVTAGFVKRPEEWEFSSYRDYIGMRQGTLPQPEIILAQLAPPETGFFLKNPVSRLEKARQAYADYVCNSNDYRAGLLASLLIDE